LQNLVEEEGDETAGSSIQDMRLQNNELQNLEGSIFVGMKELQRLNLSHNALGPTIGLRDLRGLDSLRVLDLSHNELTTLEDTSEVRDKSAVRPISCHYPRVVKISDRPWLASLGSALSNRSVGMLILIGAIGNHPPSLCFSLYIFNPRHSYKLIHVLFFVGPSFSASRLARTL
jgi:hypothetical protein